MILDGVNDKWTRKHRLEKDSYKDALNETSHQIKQLELERNQWHTKYNDLAKSHEETAIQMKADFQRQLHDRFHQFVSDWNRRDH